MSFSLRQFRLNTCNFHCLNLDLTECYSKCQSTEELLEQTQLKPIRCRILVPCWKALMIDLHREYLVVIPQEDCPFSPPPPSLSAVLLVELSFIMVMVEHLYQLYFGPTTGHVYSFTQINLIFCQIKQNRR